jgi:hypothetical protein
MVQCWLVKISRKLLLVLKIFLVISASILLLGGSNLPAGKQLEQVRVFTRNIEFDFLGWMLDALRIKLFEAAVGTSNYLSDAERHRIVNEYLNLEKQILDQEGDLKQIYADPAINNPKETSEQVRKELEELYTQRNKIAPLAEEILQSQIATIAAEKGLSTGGMSIPPVLYHSTPLPLILVISPRNVIRLDESIALTGDLTVDKQVELEESIDKALNVSSLVESIGGLGLYPTMVVESSDLDWLSEVVSHEWTHNYLTLRPLGINYEKSPELRVMNETVASIAGKEIGRAVLERYYPELVPPPAVTTTTPGSEPKPRPTEPPAFDFRKEMHITRLKADELLEQGKIQEAEQYMESRRQVFYDHGYHSLRKLNQAYFAFHGAYADEPGGAAGTIEDPVGSAVRKLRENSASLAEFLDRISWMTSFEQLQRAILESQ